MRPNGLFHHRHRRFFSAALGLALTIAGVLAACGSGRAIAHGRRTCPLSSPRVVVVKQKRVLHLFDGTQLVRSYSIELGPEPIGDKRVRDDGRTPEGLFRVVTKNAGSPYHRFLGLNYPDWDAVANGLSVGLVTPGEAMAIARALVSGACPDWSTALGGGIGIHGGGGRGIDWTAGCLALPDEYAEELFEVLRVGDPVEILP